MNPVDRIFEAFEQGFPALLLTGRSMDDLVVGGDGKIRPLREELRLASRIRRSMVLVTYSLASGLEWEGVGIGDDKDRRTVEGALRAHRLLDIPQDQSESARVIRGISSLARSPAAGLKWANGKDLRFILTVEFADHLVPGSMTPGTQTDHQIVAIELAHLLGQSLALRSSGNLVIFHGRAGMIDDLVASALHLVRLFQPGQQEKESFLKEALALYGKASFEDVLPAEAVAHLTTNTPNRGLESLLRASHRSGQRITGKELAEQKNRDVEALSEHTLSVLDTSRANDLQLVGKNINAPKAILERYGEALLHGNGSMPGNVLLVGPPGVGKTDLAILTASCAKAAAYQMLSPKGGIVGETERKARLQQEVLREWVPNLAFVDEITEALPLERTEFDGDSGASRAVQAALLTALSDETRRGKSLLVATTNCPHRMGAAMRSRFTILPVLYPLAEDYPAILVATARRVNPGVELNPNDERIRQAAALFYEKGANPRHIRAALSNAVLMAGSLTPDTIIASACDQSPCTDMVSTIYADLWAVKVCSSRSFYPWAADPSSYPFPQHLKDLVDPSGHVQMAELDKRLAELRPHANV